MAENAVERVEHAEEAREAREKLTNITVDALVVIEEVVEASAQEDEEGALDLRRRIWELIPEVHHTFKQGETL